MDFEFEVKKARQTIAVFISSSLLLIFLLVVFDNKASNWFSGAQLLLLVLGAIYFGFILLLGRRFYFSFSNKPKITINDTEIIIPTYYLGQKRVALKELSSIESIYVNKEEILLLVVKNNPNYYLDCQRFVKLQDMLIFKEALKGKVSNSVDFKTKETIEYVSSIKANRKAIATYLITLFCILIYFLGTSGRLEYPEDLGFVFLGAGSKSILDNHELYRVFSASFVHANFVHLGVNVIALGMLGELLEKTVSPIRFLNVLLFSAFIAFISFALFSNHEYGAGLSGAVFGICGAYVALRVRYEEYLPGSLSMVPLSRLLLVIGLELIVEFLFLENIDHYSHLGGFIAGFAYLYFAPLGPKLEYVDQPILFEKCLFGFLAISYSIGLSWFLLLFYGII